MCFIDYELYWQTYAIKFTNSWVHISHLKYKLTLETNNTQTKSQISNAELTLQIYFISQINLKLNKSQNDSKKSNVGLAIAIYPIDLC